MPTDQPRFLHVANGLATTRTFREAGIPGACSQWADVLYEGPVPLVEDDELVEIRGRVLAGPSDPDPRPWTGEDPSLNPVNDLRAWRAVIAAHDRYDELVLWFEHDLFDQLNLVQVLTWIHEHVSTSVPVSLICIGAFPGRPDFMGLGQLKPSELASLLPSRRRVTTAEYALANAAWVAFRQPTPQALNHLLQQDTSALPFLAPAFTRFLQEYPWTTDGLSRSERRLLQVAEPAAIALPRAFPSMHQGERFYYITDGSLAGIAETLSQVSPPLLTLDLTGDAQGTLRGRVSVTDTGRTVLRGDLDRVAACGIERWLGGVHLSGRSAIWRWDPSAGRIVRA
jgi:hypothetical protein